RTLSTMLVVYAVFILRVKNKEKNADTYRSPLFPLFQILYLLLSSSMIAYTIINHSYVTITGLMNLLVGMITFYISKRMTNEKSITEQIDSKNDNIKLKNFKKMMKTKKIQPTAIILAITLSLLSTNGYAQEAEHKNHHQSHQAFADKEAVAKMAKNFESAERDSMQKPEEV